MPATKPAPEEWLPKADAAKLLGVAVRQLERRQRQGYIEKKSEPRKPMETSAPVFYSRTDILALKAGTPNVHAREVESAPLADDFFDGRGLSAEQTGKALKERQSTALALRPAADADPFAGLAARLAGLSAFAAQYNPQVIKPWLTLDEAVEYSGLPRAFLLAQAKAGNAFATNVGTDTSHRWRFNRDALGATK